MQQIQDFGLPVVVFASHAHYDHYDRSIFGWQNQIPDITYVLSNDIPAQEAQQDNVLVVQPGQSYQWHGLQIETLRSTDQGVAFLIEADGVTLYHAGDLNFWDWTGESPVYRRQMQQDYEEQINCLKGRQIDLAFVPLDGRLGETFWKGLDYYMRATQTKYVLPMHFRHQYEVFDWLKNQPEAQEYLSRVQTLTRKGQAFQLEV